MTRKIIQMAEKITDVVPSEISDNDKSIVMKSIIVSSDYEGNDKTRNRKAFARRTCFIYTNCFFIVSATDNIRNIKCKRPDTDAIYRYVPKTVASSVGRYFIETIVVELFNKNMIFNKPTAQA